MTLWNWAVFLYLSFDLAGCFGLPAEFVRVAKSACWIVLLLALLGVFGGAR